MKDFSKSISKKFKIDVHTRTLISIDKHAIFIIKFKISLMIISISFKFFFKIISFSQNLYQIIKSFFLFNHALDLDEFDVNIFFCAHWVFFNQIFLLFDQFSTRFLKKNSSLFSIKFLTNLKIFDYSHRFFNLLDDSMRQYKATIDKFIEQNEKFEEYYANDNTINLNNSNSKNVQKTWNSIDSNWQNSRIISWTKNYTNRSTFISKHIYQKENQYRCSTWWQIFDFLSFFSSLQVVSNFQISSIEFHHWFHSWDWVETDFDSLVNSTKLSLLSHLYVFIFFFFSWSFDIVLLISKKMHFIKNVYSRFDLWNIFKIDFESLIFFHEFFR